MASRHRPNDPEMRPSQRNSQLELGDVQATDACGEFAELMHQLHLQLLDSMRNVGGSSACLPTSLSTSRPKSTSTFGA